MTLATNKLAPVVCAECGRSVARADRKQLYCSTVCRKRANRGKTAVQAIKKRPPATLGAYAGRRAKIQQQKQGSVGAENPVRPPAFTVADGKHRRTL
jgi:hypothetical protein